MDVLVAEPITFDVGDKIVHSPMVHASVGGIRTKLILDSGASDHVLTFDVVRRAGLKEGAAEPGFDHAGASVPSVMLGDVPVGLSDTTLDLDGVCAFDGPAVFEDWGIGGFLSPQSLHPSAWVVMDLVSNELLLVDGEPSEIIGWLKGRSRGFELLSLERVPGETVVVPGAIEPYATVPTMLNTGSTGTEFAASAVPGLGGTRSEGTGFGVSGASVDGDEAKHQVLRIGGRAFPVPVLLIRESMPPPPGLVGMDVLAGTILAVGADPAHPVLWLVPPRPVL
ncbi:MAG: hypothetical protein KY395_08760 [Actinobacteria bacterium]|nr:hypothetical protein [Actinomycetota bacterium]